MRALFPSDIAFGPFAKNRSSPVRIVHLTWGLGVGGAETMLGDIAIEQSAAHETWVIVGNQDIDPSVAHGLGRSVQLVTLNRPPGSSNPWYLIQLILRLRRIKPDVVHVHQESFARLRRLISVPMLLTVHGLGLPLGDDIGAYDSICCISDAVRNDVMSRFPEIRPRVVGNGIKFEAVRRKAHYGGNPFRIVQVSRLEHQTKGQDLLIRALRLALDRLGDGSVSVDFIGAGRSLGFLRRLAVDCGVESQCRFLGAATREFIYERLSEYDLLVQPSRHEGFGLTIIEGIAAGLPVLVSDIDGPMEVIVGGQLGWSFKSEDVESLSAKLIELKTLSQNPDFAEHMRARTDLSRARFDIKLTAQRYTEEYARLVSPVAGGTVEA
jgi:glycosyltransferase involved in cell wall biosynthesis